MKRIKIMLTTMIVFGTVGGLLAFKVTRVEKFCTSITVQGVCPSNAVCQNGFLGEVNLLPGTPTRCYTTTSNTARCGIDRPACNATTKIRED